jgi:hypothetical protein
MLSLPMIVFLTFAFVVLGCIAFTLRHVAKAPAGYEDESGFHSLTPTTRPLRDSDLVGYLESSSYENASVANLELQR